MADDERRGEGDEERDPDREAILARRRRFVAIALSGLASAGAAGGADGCYESHGRGETSEVDAGEPMACLSVPGPDAGRDARARPEPCLGADLDAGRDAEPAPCLDVAPPDAGRGDAGRDAEPAPCLDVAPPDAGRGDAGRDAEPAPCLDVAPPDAGRGDAGQDAGPAACLSMAAREADDESGEA